MLDGRAQRLQEPQTQLVVERHAVDADELAVEQLCAFGDVEQRQTFQPALQLRRADLDVGVVCVRARGQGQPQVHGAHGREKVKTPSVCFHPSYKKW
jgi:hypothetical protein